MQDNDTPNKSRFGLRSLANPKSLFRSTKPVPKGQDNDEFVHEALQVHNDLRRKHGVEPLRLNNDLCKLAQQWGKCQLLTATKNKFVIFVS